MSAPSSQPSAAGKPWYMKWWVWLIAAAVAVGGINLLVNPNRGANSAAEAPPTSLTAPATSETPAQPEVPKYASRPELERFLADSGVAYDDLQVSARKVLVYVSPEMSREQAQRIANDTMLFLCTNTQSPPGFVKTDDQVSTHSQGYDAADHPIAYAQAEDICTGL